MKALKLTQAVQTSLNPKPPAQANRRTADFFNTRKARKATEIVLEH